MVMLLISASARLSQDAALSIARTEQQQLALLRAELLLQQAAMNLSLYGEAQHPLQLNPLDTDAQQANSDQADAESRVRRPENPGLLAEQAIVVAPLNVADTAELSDLPLQIVRITATGKYASVHVRLQADYAIDECGTESDADASADANINANADCARRVRRIAWRRLPD